MIKNIFKSTVNYIESVFDNPWVLADDLMLIIRFGLGCIVIYAFFRIFYALMGGSVVDIINPNEW
ncbi:hypothetical protein BCT47_19655 [Vibrio splendidus]|uniref:Uncharacterized protein n=1 Tax=Vibrio splendidus TaxID=29497 RepID=A0AB35MZY7_VIBSP|nr:hypothetical protein [Vibrio splendidus]MDP2501884.1 hypothetical protein [Vibrio splendidus]PMM75368.1 hypothetical protein BCT47_19655 [Vibrio splendidus]